MTRTQMYVCLQFLHVPALVPLVLIYNVGYYRYLIVHSEAMTKCALLLPGLLPLIVTCSAFVASVHGARSFSRLSTKLNANIAIFGGSGKTGSECVYQSLSAGHKPFILARDPSKLRIPVGSGGKIGGTPLYDSNIKAYFVTN